MRLVVAVVVLGVLSGCAVTEEQKARKEQERIDKLLAICQEMGFKEGSRELKSCALELYLAGVEKPREWKLQSIGIGGGSNNDWLQQQQTQQQLERIQFNQMIQQTQTQ